MSLLFYVQLDDTVQIITDSLVSDENREPVMYQHKVKSFPHLNMVAVVTGVGNFGYQWFSQLDYSPGLVDIEMVNETATETLREMYAAWREYFKCDIGTSTIYLFGFPKGSEKIVRYIYRSKNDFVPERHEGVSDFGVKPPPQQFTLFAPETIDEAIRLAIKIREENDELRTPGPVAIGGDLFVTYMQKDRVHTDRIYRWPDYDEILAKMPESIYKEGPRS